MRINVTDHRNAKNYTRQQMLGRIAWAAARPLFSLSPRLLYRWRNWLLRLFGAKIGADVRIYPTVRIFFPWMLEIGTAATVGDRVNIYNLGRIRIGERAMISQQTHLCAGSHDYMAPDLPLLKLPIEIGPDSWLCADTFVGPGVTIGASAVVGSRSAVFKDVQECTVVGGNPARFLKHRYIEAGPADRVAA